MDTKPIVLTNAEHHAAAAAISHQIGGSPYFYFIPDIIDAVITAINQIRIEGDPIGTVRRSPKGQVAVRIPGDDLGRVGHTRAWHYQHPDGTWHDTGRDDCYSAKEIAEWEKIYPRDDQ